MLWSIFCFTITILIDNVSPYTTIAGGTTWIDTVDNTEPNYYQTRTNAGWYYPEYNSARINDQGGLGGVTGTVPGTGEAVWGWWNYWYQNSNGINGEDPARSMTRYFECGSYGTVDISVNFFMCNDYTGNLAADTHVTMKRLSSGGAVTQFLVRFHDDICWNNYGGSNPSGAQCTTQVKRCQVTDSFSTTGPGDTFVLKFTWQSRSQGALNSYHTAAMNGLQITCNQIPTKAPTISPTVTTTEPTKTPSVIPTKSSTTPTTPPSINPSSNPFEVSNFEPVININVTINSPNISTVAVSNNINESVNTYMNELTVNINYTLTADIINKREIFSQLYTNDSDREYIDVDELDEGITTSLNNKYGDGVVNVIVTQVDKQELYEAQKTFYKQITAIIAGFFVIIFIIAIVDAKKMRRNDYFKVGSLIIATMHTLDCISDIFFIILIRYHPQFVFIFSFPTPLCILFISSMFFIVVPIIFTLYQLHYIINKYWLKNDVLRSWLNKYTYFIYFMSLITGSSFAAVQICSSGAFGVQIFSMPLSTNESNSFLYRRLYSVLLMENIPQLALAIWFIMATHSDIDKMVYISMVFSGISILMSFLTLCTSKELVKTQDHCHISLDVTGNMFDTKKIKYCSQNTNDIKNNLSVLFGLQPLMIEILRPQLISYGLKITILLYISNEKYEELKVKDIIYKQHKKARFAIIFNDSWNLSSLPDIDNIICEQIASKQRAKMHDNTDMKLVTIPEGPSKIFRYKDEDQTEGTVNLTQIVMEYMDECEMNKNPIAIHEMLSK